MSIKFSAPRSSVKAKLKHVAWALEVDDHTALNHQSVELRLELSAEVDFGANVLTLEMQKLAQKPRNTPVLPPTRYLANASGLLQ